MNIIRVIAKNTLLLTLGYAITTLLGMAFILFVARSVGDVNFGKLGFAQSFTGIMVIIADLGLSTVTIRELVRQKELSSKYISNIFLIKFILSFATFVLIFIFINLMNYPSDTTRIVYLVGVSSILGSFSTFLRCIFRAFEKMEFEAFLNICKSIVTTAIGFTVLLLGYGVIAIAFVYLVAGIIDFFATSLILVTKFTRPKLEVDFRFWKKIIPLALPFSLSAFVGLIYTQIDIVMLSVMVGDAPVGWYKAAVVIVISLLALSDIFTLAVYPVMSKFYTSSKNALKKTMEKSAKYLFIMGLPIAAGTILLADRFILLLFGERFSHSIIALQILSLYLPLRYINNVMGYTLSSINKEPLHAFSITIAAILNVILNLFLILKFSFIGAAVATVITEGVLFTFYHYFVAKHFQRLELLPIFIKPGLACSAMCIFIFYAGNINIIMLVLSATSVYIIVLYLIKGFDAEDKAMFKDLKGSLKWFK